MAILREKIEKTLKMHYCNACGRIFEKGTQMRTEVNVFYKEIGTWRECPTCTKLLKKYRSYFEDDYDSMCYEGCVTERCEQGQTPEQLLSKLSKKSNSSL